MISRLVDVRLDAKRRVALPSHFLEALPAQARLVGHIEAPGRFVIETPEAAVEAASRRIRADLDPAGVSYDAGADVRVMRTEDARIADANAEARSRANDSADGEAGQRLLAALGLSEA